MQTTLGLAPDPDVTLSHHRAGIQRRPPGPPLPADMVLHADALGPDPLAAACLGPRGAPCLLGAAARLGWVESLRLRTARSGKLLRVGQRGVRDSFMMSP